MKKHEIRRAVEKAAAKHMPKVIADAGRSKAWDTVHAAIREEPKDAPASSPALSVPRSAPVAPRASRGIDPGAGPAGDGKHR